VGYELHITRALPGLYHERFPIQAAEVHDLIRSSPDLRLFQDPPSRPDYFMMAVGEDDWFLYDHGELRTKHPGDALIRRMLELAAVLDAWVLGDDDIIYTLIDDRIAERPAVLADLPYPRWYLSRDTPIPAAEWASVVSAQPDFRWSTRVRARVPSGLKWVECPPVACWTDHPAGRVVPFFLDEYEEIVDVWQPDPPTKDRVLALAPVLGATVTRVEP
jgi:hypothetical protein